MHKRKLVTTISIVSSLLLFTLSALPTLLSTASGSRWLSRRLESFLDAKVTLGELKLSWLGEQKLSQLDIESPTQFHFRVEKLHATSPLINWLWPTSQLGLIEIERPSLKMVFNSESANLEFTEEASSANSSTLFSSFFLHHHGRIEILEGDLSCEVSNTIEPNKLGTLARLDSLQLQFQWQGQELPCHLKLSAATRLEREKEEEGAICFDGHFINPSDPTAFMEASLEIDNFPLQLLQPLLPKPYDALLIQWSKDPLYIALDAKREQEKSHYNLKLESAPLQAELHVRQESDRIYLESPAQFKIDLAPSAFNSLCELPFLIGKEAQEWPKLTDPLVLRGHIKTFDYDYLRHQWLHGLATLDLETLKLERKDHSSQIGPLSFSVAKEQKLEIHVRSKNSPVLALNALIDIDQTLTRGLVSVADLQNFDLNLSRIAQEDFEIWGNLPSFEGGFPLTLSLKARPEIDSTSNTPQIAIETTLKAAKANGQLEALLTDLGVAQLQGELFLPSAKLEEIDLATPSIEIKKLSLEWQNPLKTVQGSILIKSEQLLLDYLSLKNIAITLEADKGSLEAQLHSDCLRSKAKIQLSPAPMGLIEPLTFQGELPIAQIQKIAPHLQVAHSLMFKGSLEPFIFTDQKSKAKIDLLLQELALKLPSGSLLNCPDLTCTLSTDLEAKQVEVSLFSQKNAANDDLDQIEVTALIINGELERLDGRVEAFQTPWFDALFKGEGLAEAMLGSNLSATLSLQEATVNPQLALDLRSSHLRTHIGLKRQSSGSWSLSQPVTLDWQLTPERYNLLDKARSGEESEYELLKTAHLNLICSKLEIGKLDDPLATGSATLKGTLNELHLCERKGRSEAILQAALIDLSLHDKQLNIQVDGKTLLQAYTLEKGAFPATAELNSKHQEIPIQKVPTTESYRVADQTLVEASSPVTGQISGQVAGSVANPIPSQSQIPSQVARPVANPISGPGPGPSQGPGQGLGLQGLGLGQVAGQNSGPVLPQVPSPDEAGALKPAKGQAPVTKGSFHLELVMRPTEQLSEVRPEVTQKVPSTTEELSTASVVDSSPQNSINKASQLEEKNLQEQQLLKAAIESKAESGFSIEQSRLQFSLKSDKMPSALLGASTRLLQLSKIKTEQLLGPYCDLKIDAKLDQLSGPIQLILQTPYAQLEAKGLLTKGSLSLEKPLIAKLQMHKELCQLLESNLGALSIDSLSSNQPLTLTISEKGFLLPIYPLRKEAMEISHLHAEIGQISCQNKGLLNSILSLLLWGKANKKEGSLSLWMTPIDAKMTHGILEIDRTDLFVADAFAMALWGKMDLVKNQVDLSLGITKEAFETAFSLQALPENYMLIIPIYGPLDSPSIDLAITTAKITALVTSQGSLLLDALSLNPTGLLFKGIVQAAITLPNLQSPPPKSRYPLPWKEAEKVKEKEKGKATSSSPIKNEERGRESNPRRKK